MLSYLIAVPEHPFFNEFSEVCPVFHMLCQKDNCILSNSNGLKWPEVKLFEPEIPVSSLVSGTFQRVEQKFHNHLQQQWLRMDAGKPAVLG